MILTTVICYVGEATGHKAVVSSTWQPQTHSGGESGHVQNSLKKRQD